MSFNVTAAIIAPLVLLAAIMVAVGISAICWVIECRLGVDPLIATVAAFLIGISILAGFLFQ